MYSTLYTQWKQNLSHNSLLCHIPWFFQINWLSPILSSVNYLAFTAVVISIIILLRKTLSKRILLAVPADTIFFCKNLFHLLLDCPALEPLDCYFWLLFYIQALVQALGCGSLVGLLWSFFELPFQRRIRVALNTQPVSKIRFVEKDQRTTLSGKVHSFEIQKSWTLGHYFFKLKDLRLDSLTMQSTKLDISLQQNGLEHFGAKL